MKEYFLNFIFTVFAIFIAYSLFFYDLCGEACLPPGESYPKLFILTSILKLVLFVLYLILFFIFQYVFFKKRKYLKISIWLGIIFILYIINFSLNIYFS